MLEHMCCYFGGGRGEVAFTCSLGCVCQILGITEIVLIVSTKYSGVCLKQIGGKISFARKLIS